MSLQLIFKRYDKDKTSTISSFEMRNAVNDAGEHCQKNTTKKPSTCRMFLYEYCVFPVLESIAVQSQKFKFHDKNNLLWDEF